MGIVVYYYTYYSLVGSTWTYWRQGGGKGSFPEGGFSPRRRHPSNNFFSFSHSTRVMFVHGEWAIEKGGVPASFGRYGAQRHHFETAHSIRVAPTDFHTEFALSTTHSIRVAPTGIENDFGRQVDQVVGDTEPY